MIYGNDKLYRKVVADATQDENGDLVLHDDAEWGEPEQCDAEPAQGKASMLTMPDGTRRRYSYIIFMGVETEPFKAGDWIKIEKDGQQPQEFEVLGFHKYAYQSKLWV